MDFPFILSVVVGFLFGCGIVLASISSLCLCKRVYVVYAYGRIMAIYSNKRKAQASLKRGNDDGLLCSIAKERVQ